MEIQRICEATATPPYEEGANLSEQSNNKRIEYKFKTVLLLGLFSFIQERIITMEKEKILFTSESVTEGHPDKMCDAISDAILDAIMEKDPMGRVACETATTTGLVLVMGEITTSAYVDIQKIVRDTVREIGYTRGKYGFDAETCAVITAIDEQSADIALGVDKALEAKMGEDEIDAIGAGDRV